MQSCHVSCSFLFLSLRLLLVSILLLASNCSKIIFSLFLVPSFLVREERSLEGTPTIDVVFEDGFSDTLVLDKFYFAEEDRLETEEACDYIGHLASDLTSCVAVTGCVGAEDLHITIMGDRGGLFRMSVDGTVTRGEVADQFKQRLDVIKQVTLDRQTTLQVTGWYKNSTHTTFYLLGGGTYVVPNNNWTLNGGDDMTNEAEEEEEKAEEEICKTQSCDELPATQLLKVQILYNYDLANRLGGKSNAKKKIRSAMTHVQTYYCHASLGTKVKIQQAENMAYYHESSWTADGDATLNRFKTIVTNDFKNSEADLFVGMGSDSSPYGTVGLAWGEVVCQPYFRSQQTSINEYNDDIAVFANTVAHEMGHNLGMAHDFAAKHKSTTCDGKGIMSYGDAPQAWSSCSKSDFTNHYRTTAKDTKKWCLEPAADACT